MPPTVMRLKVPAVMCLGDEARDGEPYWRRINRVSVGVLVGVFIVGLAWDRSGGFIRRAVEAQTGPISDGRKKIGPLLSGTTVRRRGRQTFPLRSNVDESTGCFAGHGCRTRRGGVAWRHHNGPQRGPCALATVFTRVPLSFAITRRRCGSVITCAGFISWFGGFW